MTTTGGNAIVRALTERGVDLVFGIPGTHNLEIYAHLPGAGIRHVSPRHEQGAGFAADGYARVTGRPGVCIMTSGPAMLNAATALAQAYSDSVPVLAVSPGMPLRHPGRGNGDEGPARRTRRDRRLQPSRHERAGDPSCGRTGVCRDDERTAAPGASRDPARRA